MKDKYADLPNEIKQAHFDKLNKYKDELRKSPDLKSLFIEMTLQCNEHCRHCGSDCQYTNGEKSLTDNEILQCLIQLKDDLKKNKKHLPFLDITGGEPLLRPGMIELMKTIHMLGYNWGMTSNGTLITPEVARQLKDAGMYSIGLSLDGTKETHDWFRQTPGGYEKAINAVKNCIEAGIESVMITTVVHKRNINELNELCTIVKDTGCKLWRIVNVDPIGRAIDNEEILLSKDELRAMIDYIVDNQSNEPDALDIIYSCNHYMGLDYERKIRPWYYSCRAGVSVASIQYNGDISACLDIERRPDLTYGNIRKDNLYDKWINEFDIFRHDKSLTSEKCSTCNERENCQGNGYHTWDFDKKEPKICMYNIINN